MEEKNREKTLEMGQIFCGWITAFFFSRHEEGRKMGQNKE
jgi:hypothetical protein